MAEKEIIFIGGRRFFRVDDMLFTGKEIEMAKGRFFRERERATVRRG